MRIGLKTRLEKLEGHRNGPSPNHILHCNLESIKWGGLSGSTEVWVKGLFKPGSNPARGKLNEFSGKFVCIPEFESIEAFERAALKQQTESLAFDGDKPKARAERKAERMVNDWLNRK